MEKIEELKAKMAQFADSKPDIYERLCIEIKEAEESKILPMLAIAPDLIGRLNDKGFHAELSPAMGYPFSYLCYLLGITDLNPFDYPEVETLDLVLDTFRKHKFIVIFTDEGGKAAAEEIMPLDTPDYLFIIKENLEYNRRTRILDAINSGREERMSLKDIPSDSEEAFEVINNLDWDGVTETYMSTTELESAKETTIDTFEKVWSVFSCSPYNGTENCRLKIEEFEDARRACQLAYLKVHFPKEFFEALQIESNIDNFE